MKLAIDSSALIKRYIEEPGSQLVDDLLREADEVGISIILIPETISAFNRRLREKRLTREDYRLLKKTFLDEIQDATISQITPEVITRSMALIEQNVLRTLDAIHVACALVWEADLFVTSDRRQMRAAIQADLPTRFVE